MVRASIVLMGVFASAAIGQSFQGLGFVPLFFSSSEATGVSADGRVVVGFSSSTTTSRAFRWQDGVLTSVTPGVANGVSGNGSVIVGELNGTAWKWSESGGLEPLEGDNAFAANTDGSVVVGWRSDGLDTIGVRWINGTRSDIGDLAGGEIFSTPFGVSGDGAVICGTGDSGNGQEAYRWSAGQFTPLGDLAGGAFSSDANGVSRDGTVIVGRGNPGGGSFSRATRWVNGVGPADLGDLAGGTNFSSAFACSADGSVVVGYSSSVAGTEAFIWDQANGMRSLKQVLTDLGVQGLDSWRLERALAVSDNGMVIVGFGLNPSGVREAWRAALGPDVPPCVADVDDGSGTGTPDGGVTIVDLLYYLVLFDAGDIRADVDDGSGTGTRDGGVTIEDLLYFLVRFDQGC